MSLEVDSAFHAERSMKSIRVYFHVSFLGLGRMSVVLGSSLHNNELLADIILRLH